jgi:class 3 adenylate cyclase
MVWVAAVALNVRTYVRDVRFPSLYVAAPTSSDGYPEVTGFRAWAHDPASGIRIGDRLVALNGTDLRGAGPVGFLVAFGQVSAGMDAVTVEFERAGSRGTTTIPARRLRVLAPLLPASLVFAGVALVLARRARPSPMVRAFVLCFFAEAIFLAAQIGGSRAETYTAIGLHTATLTVIGPLWVRALLLFPKGDPLQTRHWWPWLFAILGLLHTGHIGTPVPPHVGIPAAALVVVLLLVTDVVIVTRAYRRADPIGRRQLRWFLFGTYCASMPTMLAGALDAADPAFAPWYYASLAAGAALPIAVLISIVRFNFFDVDRLISTTASYNVLVVLALALWATIAPSTASAAANLIGLDPRIGQLGLSLSIAVLVVLAHQRLRPRIDRVFFAERYALDTGVQRLLVELSACPDVRTLTQTMGDGLVRLIRPEACVVYAQANGTYAPVFVDGRAVPRAFESDGPLVHTLGVRREPLVFEPHGRRAKIDLDPFERAVLETLDAAVVVPIWRGDTLFLLLCLGRKYSRDVYTPTDIRLLAAVADRVTGRLERFEQDEVIRQSHAMQDALRRYVPAAVAEAIGNGHDLEPAEREITVLFVDLRGFTAFCEPRQAVDVFSTVNRYTEAVSAIIRRHGGTIVEFNGDGMMAMFGAPQPIPDKEARAVRAAREVLTAVERLGPPSPTEAPFAVGVGIASGASFVGNIRSADRLIWTAVGSIVNLAARLQVVTRDVNALVAIDRQTYTAAGDSARDFDRREAVPIRGLRDPEDVYVLPIVAQTAAA